MSRGYGHTQTAILERLCLSDGEARTVSDLSGAPSGTNKWRSYHRAITRLAADDTADPPAVFADGERDGATLWRFNENSHWFQMNGEDVRTLGTTIEDDDDDIAPSLSSGKIAILEMLCDGDARTATDLAPSNANLEDYRRALAALAAAAMIYSDGERDGETLWKIDPRSDWYEQNAERVAEWRTAGLIVPRSKLRFR